MPSLFYGLVWIETMSWFFSGWAQGPVVLMAQRIIFGLKLIVAAGLFNWIKKLLAIILFDSLFLPGFSYN